jgi:hypothetical protein
MRRNIAPEPCESGGKMASTATAEQFALCIDSNVLKMDKTQHHSENLCRFEEIQW